MSGYTVRNNTSLLGRKERTMAKHIRQISALTPKSPLNKTYRSDPSCLDSLGPSVRTRYAILVLICMVLFFGYPQSICSAASRAPANKRTLLKVKVIDAVSREPIADALVSARFLGDIDGPDRINLSTDTDGCCDVSIPQPEPQYVSIYVQADGYIRVRARWSNTDNPPVYETIPEFFEFPLDKGTSIGGIVKNEKDEPIAGAKVNLSLEAEEGRIRYNVEHAVKTDADGKWRSNDLPEELDGLSIEIEHPEYVPADLWIKSAPYLKDKFRDFSAVMVLYDGITVTGVVYDDQGEPIEKALLMTGRSGYFSRIARTGQNGRFEFKHCKDEPLYLSAQAPGKSPVVW